MISLCNTDYYERFTTKQNYEFDYIHKKCS